MSAPSLAARGAPAGRPRRSRRSPARSRSRRAGGAPGRRRAAAARARRRPHPQRRGAERAVELVRAERQVVDPERLDVDRDLARRLHRVAEHRDAAAPAARAPPRPPAGSVPISLLASIRQTSARVGAQRGADSRSRSPRRPRPGATTVTSMPDCREACQRVADRRDARAPRPPGGRGRRRAAADVADTALLASVPEAVKTISARAGAEQRAPPATAPPRPPRAPPVRSGGRRRVAPALAEPGQHRLAHPRVERGGGVVVEVDAPSAGF